MMIALEEQTRDFDIPRIIGVARNICKFHRTPTLLQLHIERAIEILYPGIRGLVVRRVKDNAFMRDRSRDDLMSDRLRALAPKLRLHQSAITCIADISRLQLEPGEAGGSRDIIAEIIRVACVALRYHATLSAASIEFAMKILRPLAARSVPENPGEFCEYFDLTKKRMRELVRHYNAGTARRVNLISRAAYAAWVRAVAQCNGV